MEWLIFVGALVVLLLGIYLTLYLIEYSKFGGNVAAASIGVRDIVWNVRSKLDNYKEWKWDEISLKLTQFFAKHAELKIQEELDKIEIWDSSDLTNNVDSVFVSGTIRVDDLSAYRFKYIDKICINLSRCKTLKYTNVGIGKLILHEYIHLFLLRSKGDWDLNHTSEVWKVMIDE